MIAGPLLRLVEVPEESDTEWGMLAGYWGYNLQNGQPEYGLNIDCNNAKGFVNSNKMEPVEVEKRMSVQSDQQFTMILKQVVSTSEFINNAIEHGDTNWIKNSIIETQPRANVPYTIYNADGSIVGKAVTGANGEIKLYAGQYATLNLPEESLWTVEEDLNVTPTYSLENLEENTGGSRMIKLDENLMLINAKDTRVGYTVEYYIFDMIESNWSMREQYQRTGYAGEIVSITEADKDFAKDDLIFLKDDERNILEAELKEDGSTTLKLYFTLKQAVSYTVKRWYGDTCVETLGDREGNLGTMVYALEMDKEGCFSGDKYYLDETDERNSKGLLLTFYEENNVLNLYYKKYYTVKYTDGAEGEAFGDESYGELRAGDKTPAFTGTPEREGYKFMAWTPSLNSTVSGDDAKNGVITYTATWQKAKTQ